MYVVGLGAPAERGTCSCARACADTKKQEAKRRGERKQKPRGTERQRDYGRRRCRETKTQSHQSRFPCPSLSVPSCVDRQTDRQIDRQHAEAGARAVAVTVAGAGTRLWMDGWAKIAGAGGWQIKGKR